MINKYNWLALAFFICCMYLLISMFFQKEKKQCATDFDKVDFENLTEYKNSLICNPMSESYLFSEEECEQITESGSELDAISI